MQDKNATVNEVINDAMGNASKEFQEHKAIPVFCLGVKIDGQSIHTRDTSFPVDKLIWLLRNAARELEINN